MQLPDWASKVIGVLVLAGVVLAAKGVGWICRRFSSRWRGIVAAVAISGGLGFAAGAAINWLYFPSESFTFFLPFLGGFFGLVSAFQGGITAAGLKGETTMEVG